MALNTPRRLLIVVHSRTGAARQMAQAALTGARREETVATTLREADATMPEDLLAADGYLFACPENLAALSGVMKDFFDRCYYPVLDRLNGRPYGCVIAAGSDGTDAARQLARIATGWRLRAVAEPLILCTRAQTPAAILAPKNVARDDLARCHDLGAALAMGLAAGVF